jgi:hypothetical protein
MSRIVVFGITNLNFENLTDPSIKVYLVGTDYDYEDEDSKTIISVQTKNILDFYIDENLEESEIPTIFVDCTGSSKTYIDVMYRLKTARFDKRTYLVGPSIDTDKILDIGKLKFEEHFNPFDGDEIPKGFKEKEYLLNFFKTCSNIIYYYLKCGFDKKEINDIPPGWSINLANKELNSLCRYYGLWTAAPDVSPILDFSQNSQYRQIVLETLIAVTSNFVIRNKLVNIAEVENWNDPETWKMVWETKF